MGSPMVLPADTWSLLMSISCEHFEGRRISESPAPSMAPSIAPSMAPSTEWVPVAGKYRGQFDLQFHLRYKPTL